MTETLTIAGLGGWLARISRSRAALEVALHGAAGAGAKTVPLDLRELGREWLAELEKKVARLGREAAEALGTQH